jgi:hypothetical protein
VCKYVGYRLGRKKKGNKEGVTAERSVASQSSQSEREH